MPTVQVIQEQTRTMFGAARLYIQPAGSSERLKLGVLNEATVDFKIDQKEMYGEESYAVKVADGRRSIDIAAKHYEADLATLANDLGATSGANVIAFATDERGAVGATGTPTYSLVQGAQYVDGSLDLTIYKIVNNVLAPFKMTVLDTGAPVAEQSCVIVPATGVVTFDPTDALATVVCTYAYNNTVGKAITITNNSQNTSPSYSMTLVKRDKSQLDGSMGLTILELFAVRPGGLKFDNKESEWTNFERSYKAFAAVDGTVGRLSFVNV